jgi:hypothetical protein
VDEFVLKDTGNNSVRLIHKDTGLEFGEYFQESCRSPEWRAALIVYEKYKRKMGLDYPHLKELVNIVIKLSEERKAAGKNVSNDYLIQIASGEIKKFVKPEEA